MLKALDAVAEAEAEFGNSPRSIALAFRPLLGGQGGPRRAQRGEGGGAVRIMTIACLKRVWEYPVVAVAEVLACVSPRGAAQMGRVDGRSAGVVALVAMTRARELVILAMDACEPAWQGDSADLRCRDGSLTYDVLRQFADRRSGARRRTIATARCSTTPSQATTG